MTISSTDPTISPSQDSSSVKDEVPSLNSSLSNSQVKDASDLLLVEDNLGLDSLFEELSMCMLKGPRSQGSQREAKPGLPKNWLPKALQSPSPGQEDREKHLHI